MKNKYFKLLTEAFDSKFLGEGHLPWQYRSRVAIVEGLLSGQVDLTVGILIVDQSIRRTGHGCLDADVAPFHFVTFLCPGQINRELN